MPAPIGNKNAQKFNVEEVVQKANDYIKDPKQYGDIVPTAEGLAVVLGMSRSELYVLAHKNKVILDTLEKLNTHQAKLLLTGGLLNKFNAAITKLLLSRHGYIEKQQTDVNINMQEFEKKAKEFFEHLNDSSTT